MTNVTGIGDRLIQAHEISDFTPYIITKRDADMRHFSCMTVLTILRYYPKPNTSGNKYKLLNHTFHHDTRKYSFSAHTVNIWNSLPNSAVDADGFSGRSFIAKTF